MSSNIRVRFAPSPSGELHVGGARTALFNWLYARKHDGVFVLRIEDTDETRNKPELIEPILESFKWLCLNWDEGPFFQSENLKQHLSYVAKLLEEQKAYKCFCTPETLDAKRQAAQKAKQNYRYDGTCRNLSADEILSLEAEGQKPVVRLKVDQTGSEQISDIILGELNFAYDEVDDFIIQRSNGMPIYNFVVAVDDAEMGITHVVRAKEHQKNTLRQILVYRALGFEIPKFAHVPMVLAKDRSKLSKRHGATAVFEYRDRGYLPEALLNYLVRLGWSHGDDEIFSSEEMIEKFTLEAVHSSDAVFDEEKLTWLNQHYIMHGNAQRLGELTREFAAKLDLYNESELEAISKERWSAFVDLLKERAKTLVELAEASTPYLKSKLTYYDEKAVQKFFTPEKAPLLEVVAKGLSGLSESTFSTGEVDSAVRSALESHGAALKEVAQPCRIAITGVPTGPGIFEAMEFLGKEQVMMRLQAAIEMIQSGQSSPAA